MTTTVYRGGSSIRVIVEPRGISSSAIDVLGHLIITYTDGTTQDVGPVSGGGAPTPTPTPAASFTTQPTISPSSGYTNTTHFMATAGVVANGVVVSRAWLLNGTLISSSLMAMPSQAGTLTYQETATGGVLSVVRTATVTVEVVDPPNPGVISAPVYSQASAPGSSPFLWDMQIVDNSAAAGDVQHIQISTDGLRNSDGSFTNPTQDITKQITPSEFAGDTGNWSANAYPPPSTPFVTPAGQFYFVGRIERYTETGTLASPWATNVLTETVVGQTTKFDSVNSYPGFFYSNNDKTVASNNSGNPAATNDPTDNGRVVLTKDAIPTDTANYIIEFEFVGASPDYAVVGFNKSGPVKEFFFSEPKSSILISDWNNPAFSGEQGVVTDEPYTLPVGRAQLLFMKKASQFAAPTVACVVRNKRFTPDGLFGGSPGDFLRAYVASKTGTVSIVPISQKPTGFLNWIVS